MLMMSELLKEMSIFLVFAYVFSKTPAFKPIASFKQNTKDKVIIYLVFSTISIIGTYLGFPIKDAIANTRAIGAVLAGFIGGPALGMAVGLTAGIHRYSLGGFTALSCGISTSLEGLIGGLFFLYFQKRNNNAAVLNPAPAFLATFIAECVQMSIILLVAKPFDEALDLVSVIALPMILANSFGAALIISIFKDQKSSYDKIASYHAEKAFKIAKKTLTKLNKAFHEDKDEGLSLEIFKEIAKIIYDETGVSAVAVTDTTKVLAFIGEGKEHHKVDTDINSHYTKKAIENNEVIFVDGVNERYKCPLSESCKLNSILVVPVRFKDKVIGTIKFYENRDKRFLNINRALGEGISELLASQLLATRYDQQQTLLTKAELKLLQAQINPHFLFNSLNTIQAISRVEPEKSRSLIAHLSKFFRKNLKRSSDNSTIEEELDHINSYLEIEKARFKDRLEIKLDIEPDVMETKLPTFTLQPIVENAIKHGISQILHKGEVIIKAYKTSDNITINIEDNAGTYTENRSDNGHGLKIVDKRIKNYAGTDYGVTISCKDSKTTVAITLPNTGNRLEKIK